MKVAITGADGFLAWHVRVRLHAEHKIDAVSLTREHFASPEVLAAALGRVDTVIHLAGVNRAPSVKAVEQGNVEIARTLANALSTAGRSVHIVYGNSIQTRLGNAYGRGKKVAGEILAQAASDAGGTFADVLLPNLFGEHGRPDYNSFVATFCSEVAQGRIPAVTGDREIPLLHAQDAAAILIGAAVRRTTQRVLPDGDRRSVLEVLGLIMDYHAKYTTGQIPALTSPFALALFNTYRSFMFPSHFPVKTSVSTDQRGELFETVRSHGGTGQSFISTTVPGATRGEHFHLRKVERFFVLVGTAEIALRRVLNDEIIRFRVRGAERCFVDMPTMWVHNITNVGNDELITLFWTDQLLTQAAPDTYWEAVERRAIRK